MHWLDSVDSTSRWLRHRNPAPWEAVLARTQSAGRGRQGRSWESPAGGLYLSVAVPLPLPPATIPLLPLVAGLAARDTLALHCPVPLWLKWPNDLLAEGRKLGGLLCQAEAKLAIVGLGINLAGDPPLPTATTLAALGGTAEAGPLAHAFVARLRGEIEAHAPSEFLARYRPHESLLGRRVRWDGCGGGGDGDGDGDDGGTGAARDIAADGALMVETAAGTVALRAGEVHLAP